MFDDVKPIEQDLRVRRVFPNEFGIRRPHVHAHHLQRPATAGAHFLGEKRSHRLFGPVVANPQQHAAFPVGAHREIHLAFTPAHLVDTNHMDRRALPVAQTVLHGALHDRGHTLPVQPVLARRSLPTQFARQHGNCTGQRRGHPRPRLGPREILHPTPASWTFHPPWTVAQFQSQLPHRDITPLSFFADVMNLQASLPANPAAQQPPPEPVDPHQHALVRLLHLGYGMGFQTQLFSDKGLNEHLGSILSYSLVGNTKLTRYRGALQTRAGLQLLHFKVVQPPLHFSERTPFNPFFVGTDFAGGEGPASRSKLSRGTFSGGPSRQP